MAQRCANEALVPGLRPSRLFAITERNAGRGKTPIRKSRSLRTQQLNRRQHTKIMTKQSSSTLPSRQYSTSGEGNAETATEDVNERIQSLAEQYGVNPDREDVLKELLARKALPVLSEEERKYVRHIVRPDGKIVLPSREMTFAHLIGRKAVVIAGGSGHLAQGLRLELVARGHAVHVISRLPTNSWPLDGREFSQWYQVLGEKGIPDCDALVQLTGHSYLTKHQIVTDQVKEEHEHSRTSLTTLLAKQIPRTKFKPRVFIQASHASIYPASNDTEYTEKYDGGFSQHLIGSISQQYELESHLMRDMDMRTVQLRLGHVLGKKGFLHDVHRIDKWGRAWWSRLGSGEQWFPWIHHKDAFGMIIHAIENESIQGPLNVVAPEQVKQKQVADYLTRALPTRTWKFPMPETAIHWNFPGRAHLLLEGRRVLPQVAQETGFHFQYPTLADAMSSLQPDLMPIKWKNPSKKYFDINDPLNPDPLGRNL